MAITVSALRFLAFSRTTSEVTHYVRFEIPKKTGGTRRIFAPMPRLKHAQHWIIDNLLDKVALHDAAHGFRKQRSIVSNARPHVGADVVLNLDLQGLLPDPRVQTDPRRVPGPRLRRGRRDDLCPPHQRARGRRGRARRPDLLRRQRRPPSAKDVQAAFRACAKDVQAAFRRRRPGRAGER